MKDFFLCMQFEGLFKSMNVCLPSIFLIGTMYLSGIWMDGCTWYMSASITCSTPTIKQHYTCFAIRFFFKHVRRMFPIILVIISILLRGILLTELCQRSNGKVPGLGHSKLSRTMGQEYVESGMYKVGCIRQKLKEIIFGKRKEYFTFFPT